MEYDLKEAPLPWSIHDAALFECQVLSSPMSAANSARTIIYQGPKAVGLFIVERANSAIPAMKHGKTEHSLIRETDPNKCTSMTWCGTCKGWFRVTPR